MFHANGSILYVCGRKDYGERCGIPNCPLEYSASKLHRTRLHLHHTVKVKDLSNPDLFHKRVPNVVVMGTTDCL